MKNLLTSGKHLLTSGVLAAGMALAATPLQARIVGIEIESVEPFADGMAFGEAGAYERVKGVVRGVLDPSDPQNAVIVNLDKAPRNADGLVEYDADLFILQPADRAKGNHKLLYEVTNRGRKFLLHWVNDAPATSGAAINDPRTAEDAGNGFVLDEGYTVVWSGWDPGAPTGEGLMAIRAPVATDDGQPIVERTRDEFVFGTRGPADQTAAKLSYETASLDQADARLTVRDRRAAEAQEIPADGWAFADSRTIELLPEGTPFENGKIYDFWYPAQNPTVLGVGYASIRDLIAFLRNETQAADGNPNPVAESGDATGIEDSYAIGISQSGRALRHFIELGMNQDEDGRKVFDGVLPHISGAGKVFANHQFGQSFRTATRHQDYSYPESWFPFAYAEIEDPLTGQVAGLDRNDGFDPLVIETNTSSEYWQKGASLLHTDPQGERDIEQPDNVRVFLIAGTQHGGRVGLDDSQGNCANPRNPNSPAPALRALLVALDQWASEGVEPPASRVPTLADGTLVGFDELGFPKIPGASLPNYVTQYGVLSDWVDPTVDQGPMYVSLVPAVDDDGNEVAGIRLPPIAAPLGSYTGWNVYRADRAEGELCDRDGSFLAFAATVAEREAAGDPRPSLEERYGDHDAYVAAVSEAAEALVADRLLLQEDAARYVDAAKASTILQ